MPLRSIPPDQTTFSRAEVETLITAERASQQSHDIKNQQQAHASNDFLAAKLTAALAPHLAKPEPKTDVPVWLKIVGALGGAVLTGCGILAIVWNVAIGPVTARLDLLEKADVAQGTAIAAQGTRLNAAEAKGAQLEASMATAGRIRDQQQQGMQDQIRSLANADQAGTERIGALANTIAGILPRLEEILRRQERLENRLSAPGPRQQNDEPSVAWVPDRNI
ncbi:hypothetical protein [Pseudoroseomonas ludipueritiae]|uniref:Uncharacterized protein n=1 Tax=Pseudoroseomonas ludipueritiae TaxID=198093 RepID=A0ABR7R4Q9_9PROT|nr:hypothetical protein [Pseudoroseomonas ludipueritiae]MBC9176752.1 hypothetical protein [Pseudoroseomonas ludipueritiae]